ncbi:hypothetical protein KIN20_032856 [Parelaphostrongylus tenuis]|uniref:Uncharacterized protein n=1 Tax=Parelaphostrongylus tenuis TaxID=148309 RepID=A0AAD5R7U3_PARTN|nr:hypothetical protein KIN20_032856 [Parelaphostrongylus tenuis]
MNDQVLLDRLLTNNNDEEVDDDADNNMKSNALVTIVVSGDSCSDNEEQYATENKENIGEWSKKSCTLVSCTIFTVTHC